MSLADFQLAMADLIASPERCLDARWDPVGALARYELTPRERRRVVDAVRQRGMSTNCALYRTHRVTPIYTLLHLSCLALADRLENELDEYWRSMEFSDPQYRSEIERFAHFLKGRVARGALDICCLPELLDFELASNEMRFLPRRRLLAEIAERGPCTREDKPKLHPLIRVSRFSNDASLLFATVAHGESGDSLPRQESYVVLSVQREAIPETLPMERALGGLLWELQTSGAFRGSDERFAAFAEAGAIVRG